MIWTNTNVCLLSIRLLGTNFDRNFIIFVHKNVFGNGCKNRRPFCVGMMCLNESTSQLQLLRQPNVPYQYLVHDILMVYRATALNSSALAMELLRSCTKPSKFCRFAAHTSSEGNYLQWCSPLIMKPEHSNIYILSKVNIWNVNCARVTAFVFYIRTGDLVKVPKVFRQKMSRPEEDSNP